MDRSILLDLRRAYESGQLIAFVGAGVSASAGLPTWYRLAQMLRDRAAERGADPAALGEIEDLLRQGQMLAAVSAAKHALNLEFEREVRKAVDDAGRPIPEAARAIAALRPHLWSVITTNLDRLLERAFEGEWPEMVNPTGDLAADRHYILKMHGTLRDARTWIFTQDQYDRAMFASPQLQATVGALYRTHPILFVGFGLADDNIDLTLGQVRALAEAQPPSHYALLPKGVVGPSRRRTLEGAGIRLLEYANARGDHGEVAEVLRWLAAPADAPLPGAGAASPAAPAAPATPPAAPTSAATPAAAPPAAPATSATAPAASAPTPAAGPAPLDAFICYAPGDEDLQKRLVVHLASLVKREKLVAAWDASQIGAGEEAGPEIQARLDKARIILLLISAELIDSEDTDAQVMRAMERHRAGAARVIPILLRPCEWQHSSFKDLQPLPRNRTPVTKWSDKDEAFTEIAKELREVVKKLRPAG